MINSKKMIPMGYFLGNLLNSFCMLLIIPTFSKYTEKYSVIGNGFIIGQVCALMAAYSFAIYIPRNYKGVIPEAIKNNILAYQVLVLLFFTFFTFLIYFMKGVLAKDLLLIIFPIVLLMSQNLTFQWFHIYLKISRLQIFLFISSRLFVVIFCLVQLREGWVTNSVYYMLILFLLFYAPVIPTFNNFRFKMFLEVYKIVQILRDGIDIFKLTLLSSFYIVLPSILISYFSGNELVHFQQFDRIRFMIGNFSSVILGILYSYVVAGRGGVDIYKHAEKILFLSLGLLLVSLFLIYSLSFFSFFSYILNQLFLDVKTLEMALIASFFGSTTNVFVTLGLLSKGREREYLNDLLFSIVFFILLVVWSGFFHAINKSNLMMFVCLIELVLLLRVFKRIQNARKDELRF